MGRSSVLLLLWAVGLPSALLAGDFQINTVTQGWQWDPRVAPLPGGGFVCAWQSDHSSGTDNSSWSVQARRYASGGTPLGPEFQVNTFTPNAQVYPALAAAPDGRFVVVWQGDVINQGHDIFGQRYADDGNGSGPETQFNTDTPPDQGLPAVAMDDSGGFVAVWHSGSEGAWDVRGRRYAGDGTPLAAEFAVNTYTTGEQSVPAVAMRPGGGFVVAWQSYGSFGSDQTRTSIQARLFAPDGTAAAPEFQVNEVPDGLQTRASVGVDPQGGGFVVAWNTHAVFDNDHEVAARRYAADGTPLGAEFLVNSHTVGDQITFAPVAVAPGGDFLVAWRDNPVPFALPTDCSSCVVRARRFRSDGTPYAPEFRVNSYSTTGWREPFGVAADASGDFVVVWDSEGSPGDDDDGRSIQGAREVSELAITNDDGTTTAIPGGTLTYTVTARHVTGLQAVVEARVSDAFPPSLSCTWTCAGAGGGLCTAGPVSGPIDDPVALPVGASVAYTAVCAVAATATGSITTTASLTGAPGLFDPEPADNVAADVDGLQGLLIDDVSLPEGNAGTTTATFTVTLASPLPTPVTVDFGTSDGTATVADNDYGPVSGTLVFAPGETAKPVTVGVIGDTVFEADETFFVTLGNAVGSVIVDGLGVGTILNDDSALPSGSRDELVHGSVETVSLETQPGPVAIAREWRLQQAVTRSYEVVVDAVTGDLGPEGPALDRLASDGSVVQSAVAAAGGSSRSLRWENGFTAVADQRIRVQSRGCILDCDAADTLRVRMLETTLFGPRFNNSATQVTVVVVQDAGGEGANGHLYFWSGAGVLLHSHAFSLQPRQELVLNTSLEPALAGQAGSITLGHDARFGALAGKAVALEPATGFAFDTPLVNRSR